jgi:hypothetical protein
MIMLVQRFWKRFNLIWSKYKYPLFMYIVLLHLAEHLVQIFQLYGLGWTRSDCLGLLGLKYPWLMRSESLHFIYAYVMTIGLFYFSKLYQKQQKMHYWWSVALYLQIWHYLEHTLLLNQAYTQDNFYAFLAPVSLIQILFQYLAGLPMAGQPYLPRIEVHLFYNLIVFIPMMIGVYYQRKTNHQMSRSS